MNAAAAHRRAGSLALALVVLPVVAVLNGWIGAERWPLRTLRVTGEFQRVDDALLRATRAAVRAARLLRGATSTRAQDAVAKLPWVERAEVRKRWPDVLEVRVVEHRPFARWGEDRLLSRARASCSRAKGIDVPQGLPQLGGPDARVAEVVALYNESRALFAPIGLRRARSSRSIARGSWTLRLSTTAPRSWSAAATRARAWPLRAPAAAAADAARAAARARRPSLHQWLRADVERRRPPRPAAQTPPQARKDNT